MCHLYLLVINCDRFNKNVSIHAGDVKVNIRTNGCTDRQIHRLKHGQMTRLLNASGSY